MDQKPTYKEEVLLTLKETLTNALSTLDRLMVEDNPVLERNGESNCDSWCVFVSKKNYYIVNHYFNSKLGIVSKLFDYKVGYMVGYNRYGRIDWCNGVENYSIAFAKEISDVEFEQKIGYTRQKEENILEKGKEVLNSQNDDVPKIQSYDDFKKQRDDLQRKVITLSTSFNEQLINVFQKFI